MNLKTPPFLHITLIVLSNILVQYPFTCLGFHTTWGAFTYPLIFILTDLATRLFGAPTARRVICQSMLPGLLLSFGLACFFNQNDSMLGPFPELPLRIAFACFCAYVVGQLLDITVFQHLRQCSRWWIAPLIATPLGNLIDTLIFFSLAFYHCHHPFLSQHWLEIAWVDLSFKTLLCICACIPLYGLLLNLYLRSTQGTSKRLIASNQP